jgi:hypothetical protein
MIAKYYNTKPIVIPKKDWIRIVINMTRGKLDEFDD